MEDGGLKGLKFLSTALCVLHSLLFQCPIVLSLSFRTQPISEVQKQGGSVHLRCVARPASATITWLFQGQPILPSVLPGVVVQPGFLSVPSLQPQHTGIYQCVAHTDTDAITSKKAQVAIAEIDEFEETQRRSLVVMEGDAAVIECHLPRSNPPAMPRYRIRGKWLEESADEYLILPSGNLHIVSVSREHQGMYKCGAINPVSQEAKVEAHGTKLVVKESEDPSPVGIVYPVKPVNLTAVQSTSLVLECAVSGRPSPVVKWTKDDQEISTSARQKMIHSNLMLNDVQLSDGGSYVCSATSEDGAVTRAVYTVSVLVSPKVLKSLSDQTVSSGSPVEFTCAASGNPAPNVTWLFNSSPISPSPHLQVTASSSLRISSVSIQDQGMYQCLLDNGIGSVQSAARLSIQSDEMLPPVIVSPPESAVYTEGESVTLSCNASGQPMPVIRWYSPSGLVDSHPALLLQSPGTQASPLGDNLAHVVMSRPGSSRLYIRGVTVAQTGRYSCEASNQLGTVQAKAFLTIEAQSAPTAAAAESHPPIQSDEGEEEEVHQRPPLEDGLGEATGPPTEKSSDKPTPEAPIIISPPQTHKPNAYDLEWRPGRDWGSPITAYFIKYRKLDDKENVMGIWHTVRVPGSEKSLPLSDLEPSSLYEVLMVARSSAGEGQPAMLTFRTGRERTPSTNKNPSKAPVVSPPEKPPEDKVPGAPDRPTISTASENSVFVTWILRANRGSPITAFRVEYRKQGRNGDWVVADDNVSPLKLSVEVRNLEPGATYRFRVIAVNGYGESPYSQLSKPYRVAMVNAPASSPPEAGPHISATDAISDTQIMVRWTYTPSSNNNTPIQGFYIYYRPTDSDNDNDYKKDVVEGVKRWHKIGQLQPETSYDIKMQCFNDAGESEFSNVMICETRARQAPGSPSQRPMTPPEVYVPEPRNSASVLYMIVGCVLGVMVLTVVVFIAICVWRNRQQHNLHKFEPPPGYLYQPTDLNGHVLDYATLPGSGRVNGGCGHGVGALPQGCHHHHHHHHKLPNGLTLLNGSGTLCSHGGHDAPLPHGAMECEQTHPHHVHNGGGVYTALPQTDTSDCLKCQTVCNNNRCFAKANGTFPGGGLPMMHHMPRCQLDGLEMVPLKHSPSHCHGDGSGSPQLHGNGVHEVVVEVERDRTSSLSLDSQEMAVEAETEAESSADQRTEPEEPLQCVDSDVSVCWEKLDLTDLDCKEKPAWITSSSLTGDIIQPTVQEI